MSPGVDEPEPGEEGRQQRRDQGVPGEEARLAIILGCDRPEAGIRIDVLRPLFDPTTFRVAIPNRVIRLSTVLHRELGDGIAPADMGGLEREELQTEDEVGQKEDPGRQRDCGPDHLHRHPDPVLRGLSATDQMVGGSCSQRSIVQRLQIFLANH